MLQRWKVFLLVLLASMTLCCVIVSIPRVQEWLGWHIVQWVGQLQTWLNPPEEVSFSAQMEDTPGVLETTTPASTEYEMESTLQLTPTINVALIPLPDSYNLDGVTYYSQHFRWNYCGPANLAMLLSYWGWEGTHDEVARVVKPFKKDKSVMPYEMAEFAREQAGLGALVRVGGDLELLKRLIANGFPVMVEKGPHFLDIQNRITWMGHYQVLTGYDDYKQVFIAQDSYIEPDYEQPYDELIEQWRSFNYTYIVAYPIEQENDVLNLLGIHASENDNFQAAAQKAADEIYQLKGVDQFFAWFNYGTNLAYLCDYAGAATAYDQAFTLYNALPEDRSRPYRILWYQTRPFFAYYYTGRYQDVIEKATKNSIEMVRDDEPALEESFYWRGMAKVAIGDREGGIEDLLTCLQYHQGFPPCVKALNNQGVFP